MFPVEKKFVSVEVISGYKSLHWISNLPILTMSDKEFLVLPGLAHHVKVLNITTITTVVHKVEVSGENHPGY